MGTTETVPCPASLTSGVAITGPGNELEGKTFSCGVVVVPEDHDKPDGRLIELFYVKLHSSSATPARPPPTSTTAPSRICSTLFAAVGSSMRPVHSSPAPYNTLAVARTSACGTPGGYAVAADVNVNPRIICEMLKEFTSSDLTSVA